MIDPKLKNLRHLTGANFLMSEVGAAAEATISEANKFFIMGLWRTATRDLLDAVGWSESKIVMRAFDG